MLNRQQVVAVLRLLAQGKSQRKAGRLVGVSRGSVLAIAQGRHPLQQRCIEPALWRCKCGLLLTTAGCLRCQLLGLTAPGGFDAPLLLGLDLHGDVLLRYQELRDRKTREGEGIKE